MVPNQYFGEGSLMGFSVQAKMVLDYQINCYFQLKFCGQKSNAALCRRPKQPFPKTGSVSTSIHQGKSPKNAIYRQSKGDRACLLHGVTRRKTLFYNPHPASYVPPVNAQRCRSRPLIPNQFPPERLPPGAFLTYWKISRVLADILQKWMMN